MILVSVVMAILSVSGVTDPEAIPQNVQMIADIAVTIVMAPLAAGLAMIGVNSARGNSSTLSSIVAQKPHHRRDDSLISTATTVDMTVLADEQASMTSLPCKVWSLNDHVLRPLASDEPAEAKAVDEPSSPFATWLRDASLLDFLPSRG